MNLVEQSSTAFGSPERPSASAAPSAPSTRLEPTGLQPTELAWLAGFLDGEGCFRLAPGPRIQLSNTHMGTLEEIQDTWGGKIRYVTPANPAHRPWGQWQLDGDSALALCEAVLPYLHEKAAQVHLLVAYRALPRYSHDATVRGIRNNLSEALSALKHIAHTPRRGP
jgi:hypothetical protein